MTHFLESRHSRQTLFIVRKQEYGLDSFTTERKTFVIRCGNVYIGMKLRCQGITIF